MKYLVIIPGLLIFLAACTAQQDQEENLEVIFCSQYDCYNLFHDLFAKSGKIDCALYSVNGQLVQDLSSKDYKLVVDKQNLKSVKSLKYQTNKFAKNLMHNKFCILDSYSVITGSFNPMYNQNTFDNVLLFRSSRIADIYQDEFDELFSGKFGAGAKIRNNELMINNIPVKIFFCPEDQCENNLINELQKAKQSIYFMTFAFTSNKVGDILMQKHASGVHVEGISDPSQLGKWSEKQRLESENISVHLPPEKILLHHKVFIIDNETVVTGSFNPTKNANENNDENMLIIKDREIARQFIEEFLRIQQQSP